MQLLIRSGRPLAQIARELGVDAWALRDWKKRLQPELAQQPETLEAMRVRIGPIGARQPPVAPAAGHIKKNFGHRLDHVTDRYQRIQRWKRNMI